MPIAFFFVFLMLLGACGEHERAAPVPDAMDAGAELPDAGKGSDDGASDLQHVTLQFAAKFGSEDFACDRTYDGIGTRKTRVVPVDLRFFVEGVALIRKRDGVEVPVELEVRELVQRTDVALLDFEDNRGSCTGAGGNEATNSIVTGWVPRDDYEGIAFTNGVPEAVNQQNPIDLSAPLSAGPLHWNWNAGFLFINAELKEAGPEQAVDGGAGPGDAAVERALGSAVLHVGSDLCSPRQGCQKSNRNRVLLPKFRLDEHRVVLDLARAFSHVDLTEATLCHAVGESCSGFFPALGLDLETGQGLSTQDVYRVE